MVGDLFDFGGIVDISAQVGKKALIRLQYALFGEIFGGPQGVQVPGYIFYDYDVSADGERFVVFPRRTDEESGSSTVHVVSGWFEELRRLTGGNAK